MDGFVYQTHTQRQRDVNETRSAFDGLHMKAPLSNHCSHVIPPQSLTDPASAVCHLRTPHRKSACPGHCTLLLARPSYHFYRPRQKPISRDICVLSLALRVSRPWTLLQKSACHAHCTLSLARPSCHFCRPRQKPIHSYSHITGILSLALPVFRPCTLLQRSAKLPCLHNSRTNTPSPVRPSSLFCTCLQTSRCSDHGTCHSTRSLSHLFCPPCRLPQTAADRF
mmetsp:Transcript_49670/g.124596  ORF Transcript_49670/g.124596 Transcript_49670/m.124596 type:complete len:224 (-) Transcript_49670:448-1119(-)